MPTVLRHIPSHPRTGHHQHPSALDTRGEPMTPQPGDVRAQCQERRCRSHGVMVIIERAAVAFATTEHVLVLCRDCRTPLTFVTRPVGPYRPGA